MLIVTLMVQCVLPNTLWGLMTLIGIGGVLYIGILLLLRDKFAFKGLDIARVRFNKILNRK